MKEKRAVWTTKTQTSSSTPALSSTFFLFLSPFHSHSFSPSFSFFHLSVREKSQQIHFSFGRRSESARFKCPKPSLPNSATNHYFSASPLYRISLSFIIYPLSFSLPLSLTRTCTHAASHHVRSEGFQIPQVCFLSLKPLTQSKLFWIGGTVEWNYLFFSGNCGSLEIFSSHGLSTFLNQDCEMLQWHESAPYIWRLTLRLCILSRGLTQERNIFAPDLRSVLWFSQATLVKERADPGSEVHTTQPAPANSCVVLEPDSIPSSTFIQYMTVVWELLHSAKMHKHTHVCASTHTWEPLK